MDANLKKVWVEALRSGEYKQGTGQLYNYDHNQYCCLGVLASVAGWNISADGTNVYGQGDRPGYATIFRVLGKDMPTKLWMMNDREKKSFNEIADYIEENIHADT